MRSCLRPGPTCGQASPALCSTSGRTSHPVPIRQCRWSVRQHRQLVRSTNGDDSEETTSQMGPVLAAGLFTAVAGIAFTVGREPLEEFFFQESLTSGGGVLGLGDVIGGLLWSASLWYCTPVQLIALFFGQTDRERPSDAVMRFVGSALGQPVDAIDYVAPVQVKAAAVLVCLASGLGISAALAYSLGDATWSISSGLGACVASAVYEAGRPRRLSVEEAQTLEAQWQDFASFARQRLVLSGRCHESEVFKEFRMSTPRYRRVGAISDEVLRDMVRNLSDTIDRSPKGFLRGVSLKPRVDAFTGQTVGGSAQSQARVAVTGGVLDPRDLLGDTGAAGGAQVQQQAQEAASTQQQQGTSAGSAPQTSEVAKVET